MKKNLYNILLVLLPFFPQMAFSQTPSFLPDSLHLLTEEELEGQTIQIDLNVAIYSPEGNLLQQFEVMQYLGSGNYAIDGLYGGPNGKFEAVVLREATEEEKAAMQQRLESPPPPDNWLGRKAPSFTLPNIEDKVIILDSLKNDVVVLNFWFTTCKPCIMEMPELNELVDKYKDKNVKFLALTFNSKEEVQAFLEKNPFTYEILTNADAIISKYDVMGYPSHFVLDKNGAVHFQMTGFIPGIGEIIDLKIKEIL